MQEELSLLDFATEVLDQETSSTPAVKEQTSVVSLEDFATLIEEQAEESALDQAAIQREQGITKVEPKKYTVSSGDTLTKIAANSPFTLNQWKSVNKGIDFDRLAVGQTLNQPAVVGRTEPTQDETTPVEQVSTTGPAGPVKERLKASLFQAEGGYSTDRSDTGNYYQGQFVGTNHGISAPVLATYLGRAPTVEDMKNLSKETATDIAFNNYYDRFNISALPEDLQEIVFHSVYLGESRGVKAMQRLLGVTVDGAVGPETTEAMRTADFSKEDFRDAFIEELRKTKTWDEHGKGWTNRFNELAQ